MVNPNAHQCGGAFHCSCLPMYVVQLAAAWPLFALRPSPKRAAPHHAPSQDPHRHAPSRRPAHLPADVPEVWFGCAHPTGLLLLHSPGCSCAAAGRNVRPWSARVVVAAQNQAHRPGQLFPSPTAGSGGIGGSGGAPTVALSWGEWCPASRPNNIEGLCIIRMGTRVSDAIPCQLVSSRTDQFSR